jgi:hypothetical protein
MGGRRGKKRSIVYNGGRQEYIESKILIIVLATSKFFHNPSM